MKIPTVLRQWLQTLLCGVFAGPVAAYLGTVILFGMGKTSSYPLWKYAHLVALDGLPRGLVCAVCVAAFRGRFVPSLISSAIVIATIYIVMRFNHGRPPRDGDLFWLVMWSLQAALTCYILTSLYHYLLLHKARQAAQDNPQRQEPEVYVLK
jgi:ABC-type Mn2+/Zn2+ transport system permease subunit